MRARRERNSELGAGRRGDRWGSFADLWLGAMMRYAVLALGVAAFCFSSNQSEAIGRGKMNGGSPSVAPAPTSQQMLWVSRPNSQSPYIAQVEGGTGSANRVFDTITPAMWPPNPPYSGGGFSLSGADASLFSINASTGVLSVGNADISPGSYHFNVVVGSQVDPITISVVPQGGPWVTIDNYSPVVGTSVTVTVRNIQNTNGDAYAHLTYSPERNVDIFGPPAFRLGAGNHNLTFTITIPDQLADESDFAVIDVVEPGVGIPARSGTMVLRPSVTWVPPTAPNTFTDPFVPLHTYTVCLDGSCNFTSWTAALAAASGQDYVKIVVSPGAYLGCSAPNGGAESSMPHHLWLKGIGGDLPVFGWDICQDKGTLVWGTGNVNGDGSVLYVDNIRFTNTNCGSGGNGAAIRLEGGDAFLRNVYVTATCMGMLTANAPSENITILNSLFARNGGYSGPSHNIYIGAGNSNSTLTVDHSISQQAVWGYELKSRAMDTVLNCNMFISDIDVANSHSSDIHLAEGRGSHITNNLIYQGSAVQSQSYAYWFLWGGDVEFPVLTNNFMVATNNYFIDDFVPIYGPGTYAFNIYDNNPNWSPSPPYTIGPGNVYVITQPWAGGSPYPGLFQSTGNNIGNGTVVFSGDAVIYPTRTAASIPNVTYPIPPACTGTIGLVSVPMN